jgi:hypothetical protein
MQLKHLKKSQQHILESEHRIGSLPVHEELQLYVLNTKIGTTRSYLARSILKLESTIQKNGRTENFVVAHQARNKNNIPRQSTLEHC